MIETCFRQAVPLRDSNHAVRVNWILLSNGRYLSTDIKAGLQCNPTYAHFWTLRNTAVQGFAYKIRLIPNLKYNLTFSQPHILLLLGTSLTELKNHRRHRLIQQINIFIEPTHVLNLLTRQFNHFMLPIDYTSTETHNAVQINISIEPLNSYG